MVFTVVLLRFQTSFAGVVLSFARENTKEGMVPGWHRRRPPPADQLTSMKACGMEVGCANFIFKIGSPNKLTLPPDISITFPGAG